jgi:Icc-related predicted phosphoesterase
MLRASGEKTEVRVAAFADIHFRSKDKGRLQPLFEAIVQEADVLLLCGDITHLGNPEEARLFIEEAKRVLDEIPVLGVLGNHDFESGKQEAIHRIFTDAGVSILDGNSREIDGISFTGIKGFGGGFGPRALQPWGELAIKNFVKEIAGETQKLEKALSRLNSGPKIVMMHYAPVLGTVAGEPQEIFPFLGSSSLEGPLNRFAVTAVFHGHAHRGSLEGRTSANIPVYNVSIEVLKHHFPDHLPYFVLNIPLKKSDANVKHGQ